MDKDSDGPEPTFLLCLHSGFPESSNLKAVTLQDYNTITIPTSTIAPSFAINGRGSNFLLIEGVISFPRYPTSLWDRSECCPKYSAWELSIEWLWDQLQPIIKANGDREWILGRGPLYLQVNLMPFSWVNECIHIPQTVKFWNYILQRPSGMSNSLTWEYYRGWFYKIQCWLPGRPLMQDPYSLINPCSWTINKYLIFPLTVVLSHRLHLSVVILLSSGVTSMPWFTFFLKNTSWIWTLSSYLIKYARKLRCLLPD